MLEYTPDWTKISTSSGYPVIYCPDHQRAWSTGYIYLHRVVMEQHLGRLLTKDEIVHHRNENTMDNRLENLELTTQSKHAKYHIKPAKVMELKCDECGKGFQRLLRKIKAGSNSFCSKSCSGRFSSQEKRKTTFEHGTSSSYSYWGCRCEVCRLGQRDRQREYRTRKES